MEQKNRLRELREARMLTQAEVGLILGLDYSTVSKHESGDRSISFENLEKYARLFKVSTSEIYMAPVEVEQDLYTAAS